LTEIINYLRLHSILIQGNLLWNCLITQLSFQQSEFSIFSSIVLPILQANHQWKDRGFLSPYISIARKIRESHFLLSVHDIIKTYLYHFSLDLLQTNKLKKRKFSLHDKDFSIRKWFHFCSTTSNIFKKPKQDSS
jgi:hypothetical protein